MWHWVREFTRACAKIPIRNRSASSAKKLVKQSDTVFLPACGLALQERKVQRRKRQQRGMALQEATPHPMGNWSCAKRDAYAWYCSAPSAPPDCRKSAYTQRQDPVYSRIRPAMSSMRASQSEWLPVQIEDSRFEFIPVLPACLASVPLGTAPQYASEAWLSFTLWISKSQGNCRCWYCTFRCIHWDEVGSAPLMWHH